MSRAWMIFRFAKHASSWYSPGVAAPCLAIANDPENVYELTNKGNTIAVISDGSRVLGLGNIGPQASSRSTLRAITDEMCFAAAEALANWGSENLD